MNRLNSFRPLLSSLLFLLVASAMNAQIIYSEDFSGLNGKGAVGSTSGSPSVDMTGVSSFTIDITNAQLTATSDWFQVVNEVMEARDVDGPAIWLSSVVDISSCSNVSFSLDLFEDGDHEEQDYIDVTYIIDGVRTTIYDWNGFTDGEPGMHTVTGQDTPNDADFGSTTISVTGITGSTMQIELVMLNNSGAEEFQFDNVEIQASGCLSTTPDLIISEIHYNPDDASGFADGDYEFVEIYNNEGASVDISGYTMNGLGFTFPAATTIAAGEYIVLAANSATYSGNGYQVFDVTGTLNNDGETLQLLDSGNAIVDEVTYDDATPWPLRGDGDGPSIELTTLSSDNGDGNNWHSYNCQSAPAQPNGTPGAANSSPGSGCTDPGATNFDPCASIDDASCTFPDFGVVITEIHYNPCGDQGTDGDYEFMEILNTTGASIDISGWEVTDGITFTFPASTSIAPGEYILVVDNAATYSSLGIQVFEWGTGQALTNSGELVRLATDANVTVDEFTYDDVSPWPTTPDGDCSSLELIDVNADNTDPNNWQSSYVFGGTPGQPNSTPGVCVDCNDPSTFTETYLSDDFEINGIDQWTATADWDTTSTNAISGTYSLAHLGTTAGNSTISAPLTCLDIDAACTTWLFEVQSGAWVPGAGNDFKAILGADVADFNSTSLNAIAVALNGSDQIIFAEINGATTTELLNTGVTWSSNMALGFEIIYNEAGNWVFQMDIDGGLDNPFTFGSPLDYAPSFDLNYYGFNFDHAIDAAGNLLIDNVDVHQCGLIETYYSVATGNASDAVWNIDPNAGAGEMATINKFKSLEVRNGHSITIDDDYRVSNLLVTDVNGAGVLSFSGSETLTMFGSLDVSGGSISANQSTVKFKGESVASAISGTSVGRLHNVSLENAAGLNQNQNLELTGQLLLSNGTYDTGANQLTLISDASGTGSIGTIEAMADFTGTVEMQRFIPTGFANWVNIACGITGQTIASWDDDIITTGFTGSQWPLYPFNNIQSYDETATGDLNNGWIETTDVTNALSSTKGYMAYMLGTTQMLDATGSIQKGSVQVPLTYTTGGGAANDGWELVANIYPSAIHFDQLYALSNNISDTYYVYDAESGNYATYTVGLGGTASETIASSQSFWVQTTGSGAYLQFEESIKSATAATFERSLEDEMHIVLEIEGIGKHHEAVIVFDDEYSENFDLGRDALKLGSMEAASPEISTLSADGQQLTLNRLPWNDGIIEIPVHLHLDSISDYTFNIKAVEGLPENACFSVLDLESGETYPLLASEEIEWVIDEHKDEVIFMIQIVTPISMEGVAPACFDGLGQITFSPEMEGTSISITDAFGNDITENEMLVDTQTTVDDLPSGDYWVSINNENVACQNMTAHVVINDGEINPYAVSSTPESCNIESNAQITLDHADAYYFSVAINDEVIQSGDASGITEIENLTAGFYEVVVDGVCGMEAFSLDLSDSNAMNAEIIGEEEVEITETETSFVYEAAGESVQWLLDGVVIGNDNSVEISFENTGDYLLSLITSNEFCSSNDQMWITVSSAVGLDEHASDDWQVVVLEESLQIQDLRPNSLAIVYNSQGQRILQETSNGTSLLIDTSGWATGIYVIQSQGQTAEIFVGR